VSGVSTLKFSFVLMTLLVFASQSYISVTTAQVGESEASLALTSAEGAVSSAYQAVLRAEEVGANISGLLAQLNDAGELLAKAKVEYRLGDFDEVVRSASLCSVISGSVKNEADELHVKAYGPRVTGFWLTFTGSLVGMVAVGFGSFWGWHFFKKRYYKQVLGMKPEVNSNES